KAALGSESLLLMKWTQEMCRAGLATAMVAGLLPSAVADELTGKELRPADWLTEGLGGLLGSVLTPAGERIRGSFDAARVTTSGESEIVVDLTYRGLENAVVRAKVARANRGPMPHLACAAVEVPAGDATVARHLALKCDLQAGAPEGYAAASAYLMGGG